MRSFKLFPILLLFVFVTSGFGHRNDRPSVHDVVVQVSRRLSHELKADAVKKLDESAILEMMKPDERQIVSAGYLFFDTDQPITVFLATYGKTPPFWVVSAGFQQTDLKIQTREDGDFIVWKKDFNAGEIGLGVNSLDGHGRHYFVLLQSRSNKPVKISEIYPAQHQVVTAQKGVQIYVDRKTKIETLPEKLAGCQLIQTLHENHDIAEMVGMLVVTKYPSSPKPDQVLLSWTEDPRTTQTITWRTDTTITNSVVFYQEKNSVDSFFPKPPKMEKAITEKLVTDDVVGDQVIHRHSVTLQNLKPRTTYVYSVSDVEKSYSSERFEFSTAPDITVPFSFLYMGDPQNGFERWRTLMETAYRQRPDMAFILIAGDLVNRGAKRDDWDDFFFNAAPQFARKPVMPLTRESRLSGWTPDTLSGTISLAIKWPCRFGTGEGVRF